MFVNYLPSDTIEQPKDFNLQKMTSFMECEGLLTAYMKQNTNSLPYLSSAHPLKVIFPHQIPLNQKQLLAVTGHSQSQHPHLASVITKDGVLSKLFPPIFFLSLHHAF